DEWLLAMNGLNPDGTLVRDGFRDNSILARSAFGQDYTGLDRDERLELLEDNFGYRGDPSWGHLDDFIQWVRDTPAGPEFATGFEAQVEIDNFIDWLLVHWLIGDIDSFGDDYWLYLDHDDPEARWRFIPWDKDLSFGSHFRDGFFTDNDFFAYEYALTGGWDNLLIAKALATPTLSEAINERLTELMSDHLTREWLGARIDALAERLEDSVNIGPSAMAYDRHDQNHHGLLGRFRDQVESIRDFIDLRYAFIERKLAGGGTLIEQAERLIPAGSSGRFLLTDDSGFSLGAIQIDQALEDDISVNLRVDAIGGVSGIDREWTLGIDGELGEFALDLFYRNDVEQFWPSENWYTGGLDAIGEQDLLSIYITGNDLDWDQLPTHVNPYSNKASSKISGLASGDYRLRLLLPNP
ncbi:MAG: hypothetical protein EA370_16985, partial [Wenzhouxiangella sp.]